MSHNHHNWLHTEYFLHIISGLIIHLTNSSPNVLKVTCTLITCQQCPELLSTGWLMALSLRQYCFNMISNSETWTANNATQNKLETNLWIEHRTLTFMQQKLNFSEQSTGTDNAKVRAALLANRSAFQMLHSWIFLIFFLGNWISAMAFAAYE